MSPVSDGALLQPLSLPPFLPVSVEVLQLSLPSFQPMARDQMFVKAYGLINLLDLRLPFQGCDGVIYFPLKYAYCTLQEQDGTDQSPQPQTVSDLSFQNGFFCDTEIYTCIKKNK